MDFYDIRVSEQTRPPVTNIFPDFRFAGVKDLVCKGGAMYAFWDNDHWDTSVDHLINSIDKETMDKVNEIKKQFPEKVVSGKLLNSNSSRMMAEFDKYVKLRTQSEEQFNTKIIFADQEPQREDYATTKLPYTPKQGPTPAFDELLGKLYSQEELDKILWFVGALLTNNMTKIQKFMYLYGSKGSGKGTVINILKMIFEGYYTNIDLAHLTSGSEFATSQIKEVPLLIDEDSDISRIKNDTNLLKLTAHEPVSVNAKYRQTYDVTFNGLLVTASNQRFQVKNIDSGITRRAIVITPTNEIHEGKTYLNLMDRVKYELPMIAYRAMTLFEEKTRYYYDQYMDVAMAEATDHMFSFVREHAKSLGDPCTLKRASELYKIYLEDIGFDTNGYKRKIRNELSRYYREFHNTKRIDGEVTRNVFIGFKNEIAFPEGTIGVPVYVEPKESDFGLDAEASTFDMIAELYPAQLASSSGTPVLPWDKCETVLRDIDTSELHYVRLPLNHIVIDFDMKNKDGEKDLLLNLEASKKFPPTYTELSKSGKGVHLHYIYDGEVSNLASLYEDDIEIKVFTGKQSLRRKLTQHNDLPITHITTGLPKKQKDGGRVYQDVEIISWNEKKLRTAIKGNLEKKYHAATKPSIDFIKHILDQAEKEGIKYDLTDMRHDVMVFAAKSTNNAPYCIKVANTINFRTIDDVVDTPKLQSNLVIAEDKDIVFYDVEVFSNLFVVVWKKFGDPKKTKWINPTPEQIESLTSHPLIGFNNRRYDNHILYGRILGEDNLSLYRQSQRIINKEGSSGMYSGAYELSYADIYEYASKKQSLKKWEIELGIHHDELELPWDKPVPEELWERVAEYCCNDVDATEAVFNATYDDYVARKILSTLSGLKINATTQQQTAKFLFGDDPRPQDKFVYTDLSEDFPGYTYSFGKSEYRGEDPKEGGYVYSEPGSYTDVALLDIASMHPNSAINLNYFGPYTPRFRDLVNARVHVKRGEFDEAGKLFDGALIPFLQNKDTAKDLAYALKIIINIVYGMTSAKYDNKFKHNKNDDNIIAKRGALFMIDLKHEVQAKGFTVAHIKTDSIKIPNATQEIIDFVFEFGAKYGYEFEHEHTYKRMVLVNKSVYIAQLEDGSWEPTGSQFREPYVFKRLFSKEEIVDQDYSTTKQTTAPMHLGDRFIGKIAEVYASLSGEELFRVSDDKKSYVTGTKGFRWNLMSEFKGKDDLDMAYYEGLVNDAIENMQSVGAEFNYNVKDPFEKISSTEITEDQLPF